MTANRFRRLLITTAAALSGLAAALAAPASAQVSAGGALRAEISADPWHLRVADSAGATVLDENAGLGLGPSGTLGFSTAAGWFHATRVVSGGPSGGAYEADLETTDPAHGIQVRIEPDGDGILRLSASVTGGTAGVTAIGIGFNARAGERYLGFGERSNAVDQRGNEVENYVSDGPYEADERGLISVIVPPQGWSPRDDATYFPMPWLLSTAGYGVLLDNTERSYFRLANPDAGAWSVEAQAATLSLRFIAGPAPADALRRLTTITGRQPAPAGPWVFGPWYQPTGPDQTAQARTLRAGDVPGSAVNTYLHYLPCGNQQGAENQQRQTTSAFHDAGYAITTYFNPMICTSYSPAYGQAAAAGALNTNALAQPYVYQYAASPTTPFDVSQFDFSAPAGRELLRRPALGGGQPRLRRLDGGLRRVHAARRSLSQRRSRHPDAQPLPGALPLRELGLRAHRRPAAGGLHPLRMDGGAPLCPGRLGRRPDHRLGIRRDRLGDQAGALARHLGDLALGVGHRGLLLSDRRSAHLRDADSLDPVRRRLRGDADRGERRRPHASIPRPQIHDPEILPLWRRYAKLRTQLYPYLLAADAEYRSTGMPTMRHLALTNPGDPRAVAQEDEFMFGRDLLAAPVHGPGQTNRPVYLPAGRWVDFWRAVSYDERSGGLRLRRAPTLAGGRDVGIPAPLAELPLLVRAGAVLPLLPATVDTLAPYGSDKSTVRLEGVSRKLHLLAFPRGRTNSLFRENGELVSSEKRGRWRLIVKRAPRHKVELEASLTTLKKRLRPCAVRLDGRTLKEKAWSVRKKALRVRFKTGKKRVIAPDRTRPAPLANPTRVHAMTTRTTPVAILCGGRGARLRERTESMPKALVEIGGRPILWHVISIYAAQGFGASSSAPDIWGSRSSAGSPRPPGRRGSR